MEQVVRVHQVNEDGTALVLHIRKSACSGDCHKCSGCGAVQEKMLLKVENSIDAAVGDIVRISASSSTVLWSAVVLYVLPVVLFFAGYLVGMQLDMMRGLTGCLAFALGILIAVFYDRKVLGKRETAYRMIGFAQNIEIEG